MRQARPECYDIAMAKNKKAKKRTKLLPYEHTGKIRPHKHTSYGAIMLLLLLALMPILFINRTANADTTGGGSYQTFAVVPAPVPSKAPQINNIPSGKVYTSADPVSVSGTCPVNTLVKLFKNNVMGGATLCNNGSFSLKIDLFQGSNTLIARAYNANDVPAPDSNPVVVTLQLTGENNGLLTSGLASQFYITSEIYYRGVEAGSSISWPLTISGGQPPYAISVGWGDGKTDLISVETPGKLTISHTYTHPAPEGSYTIFINATDSNGSKSYLQLTAIVNGGKVAAVIGSNIGGSSHKTIITTTTVIQAISVLALIALSFWIGEKRELAIITHKASTLA